MAAEARGGAVIGGRIVKVITILGTRPEIIRLCRVIEKLDALCESKVFFHGSGPRRALTWRTL